MNTNSRFSIVLCSPEIPGNTGSIGRTCLALNARLILIHPLGFDISEKAVRRAGLDYWRDVKLKEYDSWKEFFETEKPANYQLYFFESNKGRSVFEINFLPSSYLIFGGETKSIPEPLLDEYSERVYHLPIENDSVRSLNLSNAATAAAYLCHRDLI